jgi:hypothetical protein
VENSTSPSFTGPTGAIEYMTAGTSSMNSTITLMLASTRRFWALLS